LAYDKMTPLPGILGLARRSCHHLVLSGENGKSGKEE